MTTADQDNCAEAEHVAAWRDFMAAYPNWRTESTANVFARGFREGMKFAAMQANLFAPLEKERVWENGYGSGWSDSRYARWGTNPNPYSSTENVLAKQGKAKPLKSPGIVNGPPEIGPIRVRLEEMHKGPPVNEIPDERRIWYVHVNECGGIWHMAGGGPLSRRDADALADQFIQSGRLVSVGLDWEKRGL